MESSQQVFNLTRSVVLWTTEEIIARVIVNTETGYVVVKGNDYRMHVVSDVSA